MGALSWNISKADRLVVIRGVGVFDLAFMTSFRQAMRAEGAAGYGKLFDLSRADIQLSSDDLQTMAARTRLADPLKSGPIAIFLGHEPPPLLVDMAVLLKTRIGNRRRLRLFTDEVLARQWLLSEQINSVQEPLRAGLRSDALRLPSPVSAIDGRRGGS
jgi:hypothetical protein